MDYQLTLEKMGSLWLEFLKKLLLINSLIYLLILVTFLPSYVNAKKNAPPILKIGLIEEPRTLNVWLASDRNSRNLLSLIYQPLYLREPETLKLIPWLAAAKPGYDAGTNSYTVTLRSAYWSDGSPLTSEDVAFTGELIKRFKIPRYYSYWKFIERIETPDLQTVRFYLKTPMAVFLTRTLVTPIVPQKEWESIAVNAQQMKKPLAVLLNHDIKAPLSSGPFAFKTWRQGAYLHMLKNEHFFGNGMIIEERLLGPHFQNIIFKIYGTADVAVLALKKGDIDMFWWQIQPGYINDLKHRKEIKVFENNKSALYFMGFNLRETPFNDAPLRQAIAVLIDKGLIVKRILQGHGAKMHSVVPAENQYWCCDTVTRYGDRLNWQERVKKAYQILKTAGYSWKVPPINAKGEVVPGRKIHLPDKIPMAKFTILTPPADYDPHRAMSGMMIQEWLRAVGFPAFFRPMSFSSLLHKVKGLHEFDTFILGYGRLSLDPDYVRKFFHSENDKRHGWNMSGYHNPIFDQIAEKSAQTMDLTRRQGMIWEMQKLVLADLPYIPLYKPTIVEAARIDRFDGWVEMVEGIGNIWSFCQIKPKG